jgi:hypothetical protein
LGGGEWGVAEGCVEEGVWRREGVGGRGRVVLLAGEFGKGGRDYFGSGQPVFL